MSWPAPCGIGPSWPQPVMRPNTSLRVAREAVVGAEPEPLHHAGAEALDQRVGRCRPGRAARPASGCLRSTATSAGRECSTSKLGRVRAAELGGSARSTRMTSAPMSASSMAANGPGRCRRIPAPSGRPEARRAGPVHPSCPATPRASPVQLTTQAMLWRRVTDKKSWASADGDRSADVLDRAHPPRS